MLPRPQTLFILYHIIYKEEPHTNIKDLPKQLAMLLCLLYVIIHYMLLYVTICYVIMLTICYYAYFDSVDFPSKDSFHTIGIRSGGFI